MSKSIAFIICTERGNLEGMSVLFAKTLRTFGGALKEAPIYSYAPRAGKDIGHQTYKQFESLSVEHAYIPLNQEFKHYSVANKVFALSYAEATLNYDIIAFSDSDMFVLSEPAELLLSDDYDIALRPVGSKGIGISDPSDTEFEYWQKLYKICGAEAISYVETSIDSKKIYGYWNSGLMAAHRNKKIFAQWELNLLKMLRNKIYPKNGLYFTEQSTFSATVMGTKARLLNLPKSYNYPIHRQETLPPAQKIDTLGEIVTAHYHDMFRKFESPTTPFPLLPFEKSDDYQYNWLIEHLNKYGVYSTDYFKRLYSTMKGWTDHKRQRIQERIYF
ncbi:MAG: hypothetical protein U0X91_17525 [Spirosomataceae bacterium]